MKVQFVTQLHTSGLKINSAREFNKTKGQFMKYFFIHRLIPAIALISFTSHVHADFVSPVLPAHQSSVRAAGVLVATGSTWTVTSNDDSGPGSLRHAVSNAAAGDTIQFALGKPWGFFLPATILLRSTLTIDKDLTILGPGPDRLIVARNFSRRTPSFRVFEIEESSTVTIAGITILNGRALNPDGASDNLGGGILNWGSLTVSNCVITRNEAQTEAGGSGYGGGIFSVGALTVLNSTVSDNEASYAGGGISAFYSPNFFMEGSTVNDNSAGIQGGGLNLQASTVHLKNSTISDNKMDDDGAGSALLLIGFPGETASLALSACTITDNGGDTNGAVAIAALADTSVVTARVINTLVTGNEPRNFAIFGNATLLSLGHNLDSDGSSGFTSGVDGDIVGTEASPVNARLDDLRRNGGLTRTHALRIGSPALDAGICTDAFGAPISIDQRGFPRAQGSACDIGSFENQSPTIVCPTNTTIDCKDDVRLRVSDPDGDAVWVVWRVDGVLVQTNSVSSEHPPEPETVKLKVSLSAGEHTIDVAVSDGKGGFTTCATT
ncbi:MAG TPA: right-handed parallel beta-helix repeat-containing protein, partial [Candidatus Acidoferrum sp.]|nr:right-handed parallel beta-helix repeat-containing protein [Candidatus Acidoferrum sp.]